MKYGLHRAFGLIASAGVFILGFQGVAAPAGRVDWDPEKQQVQADIEDWPLSRVLQSIAGSTGWKIYVEPEARLTVSTRFKNTTPNEALGRLLGDLNFALLRPTNGPAKLFVYRVSQSDATLLIEAPAKKAGKDSRIKNELVVTLKPGAKESIEELAKRLGAKVVGRIDDLHAYRLQFENEDAANSARSQLTADDDVSAVDNNFALDRPNAPEPLAVAAAPALNLKPNVAPDSKQLIVALIDTPVYGQGSQAKDFLLPGISLAGDTSATSADITHGTAMAETILQSIAANPPGTGARDIRILPVDVYGTSETTTTFDIARGIEAALDKGPSIINLSLGGESDSPFLHQIIQQVSASGMVPVAASGNSPTTDPVYPAAWPEVMSVGAGNSQGSLAPYSSRNSSVDVVAPGTSIVYFGNQAYMATGTSTATANVTGDIAAYLLAHPNATPSQAQSAVQKQLPTPTTASK